MGSTAGWWPLSPQEPEFIEPEANSFEVTVRLCGTRKQEAAAFAEHIALLAEHQLPHVGVAMTVAHVKYDYL